MKKVLSLLVLLLLTAAFAQELTSIRFVTNWFAEPEHGGFYAAVQDGIYEEYGLDVEILQGGPNIAGMTLLATDRVEFAMTDAAGTYFARNEGIPAVAFYGTFQDMPQGLMFHGDQDITDFADLEGRTVSISPGAPYWDFIEQKYDLEGKVQIINYNGQIAEWLLDESRVTQIYVTSEPFGARREGADPQYLPIADSGFNPYANIVVAKESFIAENPEVISAFIEASQEGWERFLANPTEYTPIIAEYNDSMTDDFVAWSNEQQVPFITNEVTEENGVGYMLESRWQEMYDQLVELDLIDGEENPMAAFTVEFFSAP
jgi:NitT/TauT family transport system substrate-binding protein